MNFDETIYKNNIPVYSGIGNKKDNKKSKKNSKMPTDITFPLFLLLLLIVGYYLFNNFTNNNNSKKKVKFNLT